MGYVSWLYVTYKLDVMGWKTVLEFGKRDKQKAKN